MTPVASNTVTVIHDATHATVTSVPAGTTVHDQATVTGSRPADADGDGDVLVVHQRHLHRHPRRRRRARSPLDASGVADATTFPQTPDLSGSFAFQATYSGDGTYTGSTGACEPLTVTTVASSTVTVIHDVAHALVTSVPAGTTVHDQATVTGGRPAGRRRGR